MDVNFIDPNILSQWENLLLDLELARNYRDPYQLICRQPLDHVPNPILERLLPTLLYIRMVALLDEALGSYIRLNHIPVRGKGHGSTTNLDGKIRCLQDRPNLLLAGDDLLRIKKSRNDMAHGTLSTSWKELYEHLNVIEAELKNLRFIGHRPKFTFFGRSAGGTPVPADPRVEMRRVYLYGVRRGEEVLRSFSWRSDLLKNEAEPLGGGGP